MIDNSALEAQLASVERELERWRHGNTTEGDFVCPNALAATNAQRERDAARHELDICANRMDGYIGGCRRDEAERIAAWLEDPTHGRRATAQTVAAIRNGAHRNEGEERE